MWTDPHLDHAERHVKALRDALDRRDAVAARAHCREAIQDLKFVALDLAVEIERQLQAAP